jgi:hypothetical protein
VKKVPLTALSIVVGGDNAYVLLREKGYIQLSVLGRDLEIVKTMWSCRGRLGFVLKAVFSCFP